MVSKEQHDMVRVIELIALRSVLNAEATVVPLIELKPRCQHAETVRLCICGLLSLRYHHPTLSISVRIESSSKDWQQHDCYLYVSVLEHSGMYVS